MYINTENKSDKIFAYQGLGDVWNQGGGSSRAARQGMFFVPSADSPFETSAPP